jgi:hypothetical protein
LFAIAISSSFWSTLLLLLRIFGQLYYCVQKKTSFFHPNFLDLNTSTTQKTEAFIYFALQTILVAHPKL